MEKEKIKASYLIIYNWMKLQGKIEITKERLHPFSLEFVSEIEKMISELPEPDVASIPCMNFLFSAIVLQPLQIFYPCTDSYMNIIGEIAKKAIEEQDIIFDEKFVMHISECPLHAKYYNLKSK